MLDLAGLREGQRLKQLIERAKAAGEDDETAGVLDEHVLADEEVAELDAQIDVAVQGLFVGQLDVAADRQTADLMAAAVDGLHDSWPTTGDDSEPAVRERGTQRATGLVVGVVVFGPGGAEHGHGGSDVVESVKALDELGEDAQHAPRVGVVAELLDCAALEQRAVGGGLLAGDDQPTGAAAVSAVPATGLVHQAPVVFGFGVPTSEAPLVTTTATSGSAAELRSPLDEAGSASIATGRSGSI